MLWPWPCLIFPWPGSVPCIDLDVCHCLQAWNKDSLGVLCALIDEDICASIGGFGVSISHCSTSFNCSLHYPERHKAACTTALTVIPEFSCSAYGGCELDGWDELAASLLCFSFHIFTGGQITSMTGRFNVQAFFFFPSNSGWTRKINPTFYWLVRNKRVHLPFLGLNMKCFSVVWPRCCNSVDESFHCSSYISLSDDRTVFIRWIRWHAQMTIFLDLKQTSIWKHWTKSPLNSPASTIHRSLVGKHNENK